MQSERVVAYGSQQLKNHEKNYPTDKWSVREDHTGVRGHAASMCP